MRLKQRVEILESRDGGDLVRKHLIALRAGQTEEEARAIYEDRNGPIGPDEGVILLRGVAPCPA